MRPSHDAPDQPTTGVNMTTVHRYADSRRSNTTKDLTAESLRGMTFPASSKWPVVQSEMKLWEADVCAIGTRVIRSVGPTCDAQINTRDLRERRAEERSNTFPIRWRSKRRPERILTSFDWQLSLRRLHHRANPGLQGLTPPICAVNHFIWSETQRRNSWI